MKYIKLFEDKKEKLFTMFNQSCDDYHEFINNHKRENFDESIVKIFPQFKLIKYRSQVANELISDCDVIDINIVKYNDEWYTVFDIEFDNLYLCDTIEGVKQCLKHLDKIIRK